MGLSILLALNVWVAYLQIGSHNDLVQPFINSELFLMTIDLKSSYWPTTPITLIVILAIIVIVTIIRWKKVNQLTRVIYLTFLGFLILSTGVFPWYEVNKLNLNLVNLIQFLFRFFIPTTVLALLLLGILLNDMSSKKFYGYGLVVLSVITVANAGQNFYQTSQKIWNFYETATPLNRTKHNFVYGTASEIRRSFHSSDLEELLARDIKSTPDYLPAKKSNKENKYDLYERYVLENYANYTASQENGDLVLNWTSKSNGLEYLPITKYAGTKLVLNGKTLTSKDYNLTDIGTVVLSEKKSQNKLVVSFKLWWFKYIIIVNGILWCLVLGYSARKYAPMTRKQN